MYKDLAQKTVDQAKFLRLLTGSQDRSDGIVQIKPISNNIVQPIQEQGETHTQHPSKPQVLQRPSQPPLAKEVPHSLSDSQTRGPSFVKRLIIGGMEDSQLELKPENSPRDLALSKPGTASVITAEAKVAKKPNVHQLSSSAALESISSGNLYLHSYFPCCLKKDKRQAVESLLDSVSTHLATHLDAVKIIRAVDEVHKLKEFLTPLIITFTNSGNLCSPFASCLPTLARSDSLWKRIRKRSLLDLLQEHLACKQTATVLLVGTALRIPVVRFESASETVL